MSTESLSYTEDDRAAFGKGNGSLRLTLLFFFMLANTFQPAWPPIQISTTFDDGGFIKLHHLVALSMLDIFLSDSEKPLSRPLMTFFAVAMGTTLFAGVFNGFQFQYVVLILYAFYASVVGTKLWQRLGPDQFVHCLRIAGRMFLFAVLIEVILNFGDYVKGFAGDISHPNGFLAGGGPGSINVECSFAAIVVALEFGTPLFYPLAFFSLAFAAGAASRSGELATLMLISLRIWLSLSSRARWLLIACIVATAFFVGTALMSSGSLSELGILQRFAEVGSEEDAGSLGRLILWYGAFMAFLANPLGYGAGAAALLVSRTMPNWLGEMNVHNVYLQFAVDLGIQGLLAFVAVAVSCVRRFAWGHWRHPLGAAVVIYLILAFQGFRGYDHFMFMLYGALTIATRQEMAAGVDRDDEEEDAGVVAV